MCRGEHLFMEYVVFFFWWLWTGLGGDIEVMTRDRGRGGGLGCVVSTIWTTGRYSPVIRKYEGKVMFTMKETDVQEQTSLLRMSGKLWVVLINEGVILVRTEGKDPECHDPPRTSTSWVEYGTIGE